MEKKKMENRTGPLRPIEWLTVIWIATDLAANVLLIVAALHGLAWLKRNKNK